MFPVTLSAASSKTVSVAFATGAGTATAGVDFVAASGPLTFAPGEVSKVVNVAVVGDMLNEAAETFTVTLSAPSAATIATPQATGTITDNDPLPVAVADTYATPFGVPLVVAAPGVLANDTNTHGGTMSAELVAGVAHGTLALGANGSVNYTPAAGYAGTDSFVYRVVDASGTGNSVSVAITIAAAAAAGGRRLHHPVPDHAHAAGARRARQRRRRAHRRHRGARDQRRPRHAGARRRTAA